MAQHQLFETDIPVTKIQLLRYEASGPVYYPRGFEPAELTGLDSISAMFGGGTYEVLAYGVVVNARTNKKKHCVIERRKFTLPGPSKPLMPEPQPAPHAAASPAVGGADPFASMMQFFMAQQERSNAQFMQLLAAMQKNSTDVLVAVLGRGAGGDSAATTALAEIAKAALQAKGEGAALDPEKYIALGHRLGSAEAEVDAGGDDDEGSGLESFLGGFLQHQMSKTGGEGGRGPAN